MTPAEIVMAAARDGVVVALTPAGTLKVSGENFQVQRWAAQLRDHKPAILAALQEVVTDPTTAPAWLLHFPDTEPLEVHFFPATTHAEALAVYPDAVEAEPFAPKFRQSSASMTAKELQAILAWLELIEETDPATIADVLSQCQRDAEARDYFSGRAAAESATAHSFRDDLRTCANCANLRGRVCRIAEPAGLVSARRGYEPSRDLPRRCEGFAPGQDDPDQRPGWERWPGLIQKGDK